MSRREIEIEKIDLPKGAGKWVPTGDEMDALIQDVKSYGWNDFDLGVDVTGDRYVAKISYDRVVAAKRAGLKTIPSMVFK